MATTKTQLLHKSSKCCDCGQAGLCVLALFVSPVAVLIEKGISTAFVINLLLYILGFIGGVVHGWYVILGWRLFKRILWALLATILPPLVVLIKTGCSKEFLINLLLTIFLFLPGVIHAWYVIYTYKAARVLANVKIQRKYGV